MNLSEVELRQRTATYSEIQSLFVPELAAPPFVRRFFPYFMDQTRRLVIDGQARACLEWIGNVPLDRPPYVFVMGRRYTIWEFAWRVHYARLVRPWLPRPRPSCATRLCVHPDHLEPRLAGRAARVSPETAAMIRRSTESLQPGQQKTPTYWAQRFGVSERTVYRWMQSVPISNDDE